MVVRSAARAALLLLILLLAARSGDARAGVLPSQPRVPNNPFGINLVRWIDGRYLRAAVPDVFTRLHGWASSPYYFYWGVVPRYTYRAYETELQAIGRDLPVIVTEFHPQYIDDEVQVANYYEDAFKHWLADPRVIAATPMFWNPELDRFWMYGVDLDGAVVAPSPTYARIKSFPKVAGSPQFSPTLENVVRPPASP